MLYIRNQRILICVFPQNRCAPTLPAAPLSISTLRLLGRRLPPPTRSVHATRCGLAAGWLRTRGGSIRPPTIRFRTRWWDRRCHVAPGRETCGPPHATALSLSQAATGAAPPQPRSPATLLSPDLAGTQTATLGTPLPYLAGTWDNSGLLHLEGHRDVLLKWMWSNICGTRSSLP